MRVSAPGTIFPDVSAPAAPISWHTAGLCRAIAAYRGTWLRKQLYLPPIHPIGHSFRKGKNGTLKPLPDDPGSPWAIGSEDGGHKSIHPKLGNLADFRALVAAAEANKLRIALDIALQCSPDHPYVREHPTWFSIVPTDPFSMRKILLRNTRTFTRWILSQPIGKPFVEELKSIFEFWIEQGVCVFRVDNPHTKTFRFLGMVSRRIEGKHIRT